MSLVRRYPFNQQTSLLIQEFNGEEDLTAGGGVVSVNDASFGDVASFDSTSTDNFSVTTPLTQIQGSSNRTICYWCYRNPTGSFNIIHSNGTTSTSGSGWRTAFDSSGLLDIAHGSSLALSASSVIPVSTWTHIAETYDGNNLSIYFNGVLNATKVVSLNTSTETLTIGNDAVDISNYFYNGYLLDFRIYDDALTDTELLQLTSEGPNFTAFAISATMYTHIADISWGSIDGVSVYILTRQENSGVEETILETTGLNLLGYTVSPGSSYIFTIYTNLDMVNPAGTLSIVSPNVDQTTTLDIVTRLSGDITILSQSAIDQLDPYLPLVFNHLDTLTSRVSNGVYNTRDSLTFLDDSQSTSVQSGAYLLPFDPSGSSGQQTTIVTSDSVSTEIYYDETTDEVIIDGMQYSLGNTVIVGNKRLKVYEID